MASGGELMADTSRDKLVQTWFDGARSVQRAWKSRFHAEMSGETLSVGQLSLLFYLAERQPVTSKQIATDTHSSKSAVAQLLDGLDQLQLLARRTDPADRRVAYVSLNPAGEAKVRSLQEKRKTFFVELAEALSDEDIATMVRVQQKILQQLEKKTGELV